MLNIYVDADACPVKEEICRVAMRHNLQVYLVSNSRLNMIVNKNYASRSTKQYCEENRDILKSKRGVKNDCECGGKYTKHNKLKHEQTKKHQTYINNQTINNNQNQTINNTYNITINL